jgi:hypothetical protein
LGALAEVHVDDNTMIGLGQTAFLLAASVAAAVAANDPCYICGSKTAILTSPNAIVPIPAQVMAPVAQISCQDLDTAGLEGLITADACDLAHASQELQDLCGCQDEEKTLTAVDDDDSVVPTATPISDMLSSGVPSEFPSDTPSSVWSDTPTMPPVSSRGATIAAIDTSDGGVRMDFWKGWIILTVTPFFCIFMM